MKGSQSNNNRTYDIVQTLGEIKGKVDMILEQTTKTNGHVSDLYERIHKVEGIQANCPINEIVKQTEVSRFYSKYPKHLKYLLIGIVVITLVSCVSVFYKAKIVTDYVKKIELFDKQKKDGEQILNRPE